MIAIVEIAYSAQNVVKSLSRERYEDLRKRLDILGLSEWAEGKSEPPPWYTYGSRILVDMRTDIMILDEFGIEYRVVKFRNTYQVKDPSTHTHVHVHIPNFGLLQMREVINLDDACTYELQRHLDDGWHILAICPPNATRRPDYILGRADKK
jgi:hypothetical protein